MLWPRGSVCHFSDTWRRGAALQPWHQQLDCTVACHQSATSADVNISLCNNTTEPNITDIGWTTIVIILILDLHCVHKNVTLFCDKSVICHTIMLIFVQKHTPRKFETNMYSHHISFCVFVLYLVKLSTTSWCTVQHQIWNLHVSPTVTICKQTVHIIEAIVWSVAHWCIQFSHRRTATTPLFDCLVDDILQQTRPSTQQSGAALDQQ